MGIYNLKMHLKVVRYQMSHFYLCSKSKTIMKKSYFVYFIADYFPTLNKKDPVTSALVHLSYEIQRCTRTRAWQPETLRVNISLPWHQNYAQGLLNSCPNDAKKDQQQIFSNCKNGDLPIFYGGWHVHWTPKKFFLEASSTRCRQNASYNTPLPPPSLPWLPWHFGARVR